MKNNILYISLIIFEFLKYKNIYSNNNSYGYIIINSQLNKLKIGLDNKEKIIEILGNPSIIDPFTNKIWFYINYKVKNNKIVDLNKIVLHFNEEDILIKIDNNNSN
ncbi:outer membrane protein assembly factor BamE [endosymbiont of Pachyrhynchus infernalis]|uniref:outer membrane protein assembly factor BamE n=1 Tax=endosymbiont of Pachyrhynchus infernalis TaxID=1971488 RepID=UPI000DC6F95C|nr:outer membrane protein assembly factor BamE [endosymbiont of Pachyrhynchus infernalis]BBA84781.1 outer membrane protein assembly factor BamE [endosymbiont of Pachyrhynchus infernalis]